MNIINEHNTDRKNSFFYEQKNRDIYIDGKRVPCNISSCLIRPVVGVLPDGNIAIAKINEMEYVSPQDIEYAMDDIHVVEADSLSGRKGSSLTADSYSGREFSYGDFFTDPESCVKRRIVIEDIIWADPDEDSVFEDGELPTATSFVTEFSLNDYPGNHSYERSNKCVLWRSDATDEALFDYIVKRFENRISKKEMYSEMRLRLRGYKIVAVSEPLSEAEPPEVIKRCIPKWACGFFDKYDHGSVCYSLHTGHVADMWDTSPACWAWVLGPYLVQHITSKYSTNEERAKEAQRIASSTAELMSDGMKYEEIAVTINPDTGEMVDITYGRRAISNLEADENLVDSLADLLKEHVFETQEQYEKALDRACDKNVTFAEKINYPVY